MYLILEGIRKENENLKDQVLNLAPYLLKNEEEKVRQTTVYTFSEIGKIDANKAFEPLEIALNDENRVVKNAVMGALKQMGEKNQESTLKFAKKFLNQIILK